MNKQGRDVYESLVVHVRRGQVGRRRLGGSWAPLFNLSHVASIFISFPCNLPLPVTFKSPNPPILELSPFSQHLPSFLP